VRSRGAIAEEDGSRKGGEKKKRTWYLASERCPTMVRAALDSLSEQSCSGKLAIHTLSII
jgi:hypothetical protein